MPTTVPHRTATRMFLSFSVLAVTACSATDHSDNRRTAADGAAAAQSDGNEVLPAGIREHVADANGTRLRYLDGGQGSAVILLHGYAQTSHMWLPLMPVLAANHRVIAPDLRGAGGSARPESGYDKRTMANDVHALAASLGIARACVVGHDIGLMVAYAYAAQHPLATERVILMDAFLPGIGEWKNVWLMRDLWHFHFYGEVPLQLVQGRERIYFEHFWNDFAADRSRSVPEVDRRFYARAYTPPGGMRAGFEYFRAFEQDARDFAELAKQPLAMPMLVLTGEKASGPFLIEQAGEIVPSAGHWLMEEAREPVVRSILSFLHQAGAANAR